MLETVFLILFMIGMICLLLNREPKFIAGIRLNRPKAAYYLVSIGWIPYVSLIIFAPLIWLVLKEEISEETVESLAGWFRFANAAVIVIPLGIAWLLKRIDTSNYYKTK
jgi:hypothetical protein